MNLVVLLAALILNLQSARATEDSMPGMPRITATRTYVIKTTAEGEALQENRGFGEKSAEVRMMNLMMVEGSGLESMNMSSMGGMKMAAAPRSQSFLLEKKDSGGNEKVGRNLVQFLVRERKTGKEVRGLKLKAEVFMTNMDMGTESLAVEELRAGQYQLNASFAMKGDWSVKIIFPNSESETLSFHVDKAP